jgi:hypothetical protein
VTPGVSRNSRCVASSSSRWRISTPGAKSVTALVLRRFVGHHDDAPDVLGGQLARELRHGQGAVHRLAAGHGDGVVVEQLVGDVDLAGDGGADRQES